MSLVLAVVGSLLGSIPPQSSDPIADRLRKELTPYLDARARDGRFSGVVVVARKGDPIYSAAHGSADRDKGTPITVATRFNLGSANKMWTAIAIAKLVEQGKVDVEAPVGRYLPDLPNAALRDRVTIRHLLSHTSGLGTYFQRGFLRNHVYVDSMVDYLPDYVTDSLSFTPGARMQYSNAGFALLGLVIERVSGRPYYDFVKATVLEPAGMKMLRRRLRARFLTMVRSQAPKLAGRRQVASSA